MKNPKEKHFIDLLGKVKFDGTKSQLEANPKGWRGYFVCTYAKREQLTDIFAYCSKFAWITHDQDVEVDGKPKAVHSHFIVRYNDQMTPSAFAKRIFALVPDERTIISPLGDKHCAMDYMLHKDAKSVEAGKHMYKESEVLTDDYGYFFRTKEETKLKHNNDEFFADLLDGNLTRREMALKYGRDYAKNMRHYDNFAKEVYYEEYAKEVVEEAKNASADWLDICFTVVKKAIHPYVAQSNTKPSDKFLYDQIARLFEDQIITRTNKGEVTR